MQNPERTFALLGMTCQHCARTIQAALERQPGVATVRVNYLKKLAEIDGDASDEAIEQAVRDAGYRAIPKGEPSRA